MVTIKTKKGTYRMNKEEFRKWILMLKKDIDKKSKKGV